MDETVQDLLAHLRGMWNRRFLGLLVAWAAAIVGVAVALRIPDRYEASARVNVDTQSLLRPVMQGLSIQPSLDQQVALMSRTLLSRPNLEKLVAAAHLDAGLQTPAQREELLDRLARNVSLTGSASTNLYTIAYLDQEPERALHVVQTLLDIFLQSSLGGKRQDTETALKFLDEQIAQDEQTLKEAEDRLKNFRLKYLGIAGQGGVATGQDYFARMSKLADDISATKLELRAAVESRDSYRRGLAQQAPTVPSSKGGASTGRPASEIDQRIATQKAKLDELLRTYTDDHPDVVGTRRVLAALEEQRRQERLAAERAAAQGGKPADASEINPIYEKISVALSDAEAKVASLQGRLGAYESELAQLKAAARVVPQVEAEHAQLNRDYDIQKKTYADLLARREAAKMGVGVQETEGVLVRVIDPPRVPPFPVQPSRKTNLAIALVAALLLGLLASFVANQVSPTVHDTQSLRETAERPILGVLSTVPNPAVRRARRRRASLFVGGLGSLLAAMAIVVLMAWRAAA